MGASYIPFQPRTLDELAQSAQSFDPMGGNPPANLARMLMPDMGNVAMPESPQQTRRGKANVFKQILGDFLYSYGQGLAAGGGVKGTGVALLAPMLRRQQQEQQEMEAAEAAQQQAQAQRKQQFDEMNILSQIQARAQGPEAARPQHIGGGYVLYPDGRIEKAGPEERPPQATEAGLKERWAQLEAKPNRTPEEEALRQALGRIVGPEAKQQGMTPFSIQEYEYARDQGFKGTIADWKKLVAETYGDIRFQMMIDTATGRPTAVFPNDPSRQLTVPAPLATPEFAGKAAEAKAVFATADGMLNQIEALANKVITAQGPLEAAGQYAKTTLGAAARTNTDAAVFLTTKDAFGSMLTRAAGQTGVLTQQDVEYILRALPAPGDTVAIAQGKMRVFRALYRGIVDAKLSAYGAAPLGGPAPGGQTQAPATHRFNPATERIEAIQ